MYLELASWMECRPIPICLFHCMFLGPVW